MTFSTFASPGVSLQGGGGSSGGGGTPGGSNTQIQYNNSGAFAGASGLTTNGTELTIASGTITADAPVLNMSQTWNNGAVTFTGLKFNATDTASNAASLLMDLQVGTVSRVAALGTVTGFGGAVRIRTFSSTVGTLLVEQDVSSGTLGVRRADNYDPAGIKSAFWEEGSASAVRGDAQGFKTGGSRYFGFGATSAASTIDLFLTRRGAANLRLGAADTTGTTAPTPQFLSAQSWASSTTNNQTGANFTIDGSQGTGTGAGGSIIFRVAPAGGTSNGVQNALATALTIDSNRNITIGGPYNDFQFRVPTGGGSRVFTVVDGATSVLTTSISGTVAVSSFGLGATIAVADVILARDAPNTLALRNGANAQAFNIYNTFTDASNYERAFMRWATNVLYIGSEKAGTGVARTLSFQTDGTDRWYIATTGHLWGALDNTYDIGASGANRPRNVYVAGSVLSGNIRGTGFFEVGAAQPLLWVGRSYVYSPADGNILVQNNANTDFGRLQFGGTTSSFPALKRSSTTLQVRLADDSAFASVQGKLTTDTAYTATVIVPTGYLTLYDSTGTAYRVPCVV
jgi:hypothetical protein